MDATLGILVLLWGLLDRWCGKRSGRYEPSGGASSPSSPSSPVVPSTPGLTAPPFVPVPQSSAPPWPTLVPADLPKFPGAGWEFDEPPPKSVQLRAGQLLPALWKLGKGAYKTEKTAGRWITYQAQRVASGKKGVVAYRPKEAPKAKPPQGYAPPPRIYEARSPGIAKARNRAVAHPLGLPVLRYGRGLKPAAPDESVRVAQRKLGVTPDGRFGKGTREAVRAFQTRWMLTPDGVVGPKTWAKLLSIQAI